jgi:protein associated with RNAse G/E
MRIMSIKQYQIINVQAYKHDGTLYRQWNGLVVFDVQPKYITLIMPQTKVIEKNGQH